MSFSFDDFAKARTIVWATPEREWRFRSIHGLTMKQQSELNEQVAEMTITELLAYLAKFEGIETDADELNEHLSDTEQLYIFGEVQKKISVGE